MKKLKTSYELTFNPTGPEEDDIAKYIIDWGDGSSQETSNLPFPSE